MKKTSILSFLFLALTASIIQSVVCVVLDTDGNPVLSGTEYYILPANSENGGGLKLGGTCPLDVVQGPSESDTGYPAIFSPVEYIEDASNPPGYFVVAPEGTPLNLETDSNIIFSASSICVQTTVWTVKDDSSTEKRFVTTGGLAGNPGKETGSNWFKVRQFDNAYKLVYCPVVCSTCRPNCGELGIDIAKSGTRRLVLRNDDPFKVVFKKVV